MKCFKKAHYYYYVWGHWCSNHLIWQSEGNFPCCESGMENVRAFSSERNRLVSGRTGNPSLQCREQIRSIQGYIQKESHLCSHSSTYCKSIIHKYLVPLQKSNNTSLSSSDKPVPVMKKLQYGLICWFFFPNLITFHEISKQVISIHKLKYSKQRREVIILWVLFCNHIKFFNR